MNRIKLYKVIEFLKSVDFYHDRFDIEENGIRKILMEYGIYTDFTEEELQELERDLFELAEHNEIREAIVFATHLEEYEMIDNWEGI